ncbi:uncharacterized protein PHACADRAFT_249016 [Phanerochaete carnosa HHB-10118-sp]|uniref:Uncharacterized protein n=1 Tax=Phanerochaete carnosa (strain HHB-10118-sp) TaxID=650164 RepID=K5WIH9_PHACS|nr:uncharacterized protein PHACADRAFT_249016 [Phanerochaete carnosa HHB-10118-sp]EKM58904.1 hypothetical protein PHACADRAFT_249016 [Phanerochaete carnosa HHB-10118-sp]
MAPKHDMILPHTHNSNQASTQEMSALLLRQCKKRNGNTDTARTMLKLKELEVAVRLIVSTFPSIMNVRQKLVHLSLALGVHGRSISQPFTPTCCHSELLFAFQCVRVDCDDHARRDMGRRGRGASALRRTGGVLSGVATPGLFLGMPIH